MNDHRIVLLLSGPIAVGKTSVADSLIDGHGFTAIKSGNHLRALAADRGGGQSRLELQKLGDSLDEDTDYRWLIDDVASKSIRDTPGQTRWLLDSVRKERQVAHFRQSFKSAVFHAHLTAPEEILEARYNSKMSQGGEYSGNTPYAAAAVQPNEVSARALSRIADIVIELHDQSGSAVANAIIHAIGGRHGS
ncbi:AAA family ATPase [Dongia sp. agr-C8]